MKAKIFFYLVTILFSGCSLHGQDQQGIIIDHTYLFGTDSLRRTKPPLDIRYKIFFRNNQSIQEVPLIVFTSDSSGKKTVIKIKHYSYIDADKNACFNYGNFIDTAKAIKNYSDIDSVSKDGGWNFLSNAMFEYDSSKNLKDTTIKNINYGRIRLNKTSNGNNVYFILYYRCNKKETLIKLFKPLSDSIGCPIVRDDTFIKNQLFMTRELEFFSDKLSNEELKIFDAWKKNEEKYPVYK